MAISKDLVDGPREVDMHQLQMLIGIDIYFLQINILQWMTRAALEMVGQSGLGYSFDSLSDEESENTYTKSVKELLSTIQQFKFYQEFLLPILIKMGTPKLRRVLLDLFPSKRIQKIKKIIDILDTTSIGILDGKKQALEKGDEAVEHQVGQGKDIISILMNANMAASERDRLEKKEVLGQVMISNYCSRGLIFAAMDTTSNALSRTLFILAQHPEAQEKLRQEIREARELYGEIPHDELMTLPYLDAICREILRLSKKDAVVPLSTPIKGHDGKIPTSGGLMCWNGSPSAGYLLFRKQSWKPGYPESTLICRMTFNDGGRSCIGFKFSQLEMKVVLSVLIDHFRFSPGKEEIIWQMGAVTIPTLKGKPGT
ncbi:hypothetical protein H0H81_012559 [Sphagnurus paluster]|uniref:Cytochrome P450 n=1 Tax=Sphagnurus paluster TaxID=117069 RepID=A0A9P7FNC1_9AGAR|nr:hypothetical protein H0H81_012559 [Sphagnurus paluster]